MDFKRKSFLISAILSGILFIILSNGCQAPKPDTKYLQKVLSNLEQIQSASYSVKSEGWAPGDTSAYAIYNFIIKEYTNPADTTIGSSFVKLSKTDPTKMSFCYDGYMRAVVYEDHKTIVIDSFNVRILPFRPVNPPFFNNAKNILKYALETNDSLNMHFEDLGDSVYFKIEVFNKDQVEFFGRAHYINNPFGFGEEISQYELWINKSNNLPYKIRREMSHDISVITCSDVEFNKIKQEDFKASDYFQPDYSIQPYRMGKRTDKNKLEGQKAPKWILKDAEKNEIALEKIDSKVILIEFTSVSCGPCLMSIPFLKQLSTEYDKSDFELVSIEAFAKNSNVLKKYQERNNFDYKFVMSTKEVTGKYKVQAVPVFFILDQNRIIRKVINGYGKGTTDEEIRAAINELI